MSVFSILISARTNDKQNFIFFSFVSGITLLGLPTEIYSYGIQYVYVSGAVVLMGYVMGNVYLPVFHDLNITSTYEVNMAEETAWLRYRMGSFVRMFNRLN